VVVDIVTFARAGAPLPSKMLLPNHALRAVVEHHSSSNTEEDGTRTNPPLKESVHRLPTSGITTTTTHRSSTDEQTPSLTITTTMPTIPFVLPSFVHLTTGTQYVGHFEQAFDDHVYAKSQWNVVMTIDIVNDYLPTKPSVSVSFEWRKHTQEFQPPFTLQDGTTSNPDFPTVARQWAVALLSNLGQVHYSKARGPIDMTTGVVDLFVFEALTGVGAGSMRFFLPREGNGEDGLDGVYWIGRGEAGMNGMGLFRLQKQRL
jgi:hypothetical protein